MGRPNPDGLHVLQRKFLSKVSPPLQSQLRDEKEPIGAIFYLNLPEDEATFPTPEEIKGQIERVIEEASAASGEKPSDIAVFENVGSFSLRAPRELVEKIIERPEVFRAAEQSKKEDIHIRPMGGKRVDPFKKR